MSIEGKEGKTLKTLLIIILVITAITLVFLFIHDRSVGEAGDSADVSQTLEAVSAANTGSCVIGPMRNPGVERLGEGTNNKNSVCDAATLGCGTCWDQCTPYVKIVDNYGCTDDYSQDGWCNPNAEPAGETDPDCCNPESNITKDLGAYGGYGRGYPDIDGDRIVYYVGYNQDIYMYDLATNTETQITTNFGYQAYPVIDGNIIVWQDSRSGFSDIYMYDLADCTTPGDFSTCKETPLSSDAGSQANPAISGDKIVWNEYKHGEADIYMYDLSDCTSPGDYSTCKETQITTDTSYQSYPAIDGNIIVWQDSRSGISDIYMYDLSDCTSPGDYSTCKETQITTDTSYQINPAIDGNIIVWEDSRNDNNDIYMYDLSDCTSPGDYSTCKETRITTGLYQQSVPAIDGNIIVWQDRRSGIMNEDIYMCDLSLNGTAGGCLPSDQDFQVTSAPGSQRTPAISGDKIVWSGAGQGIDIGMYDLSIVCN